ncbi:MAG: hypothetical protein APG12_00857 [Candidatus Methanofastidiosum methylothiophilum]|uniref:Uncharacterized protein n=1 Tax=Candidatus Methanofastidiosum methylothiophilum TaxID=1705564 RepID=A0A150IQ26_9EURY|nr:MAG: hypothetical protein APG10_01692 [Candidatus Methanofastidiosum methylthiophilus]KYC46962.1 MAG: hypothetical protein APG11_01557 [Candidatus Methanofastidiosum methylthiophilus]KYC50329.1 MAG: hypothetical protein APG12_00857 [Candidatus Methanofastidiosum methylthiophilus]
MTSDTHREAIKNLLLEIICAIDSSEYQISVEEVEEEIESGRIMEFLGKRISIVQLTTSECELINEELKKLLDIARPQIEKYWGIKNSGLCYLTSLIIEAFWK